MKKIFLSVILLFLMIAPAYALSDAEYLKFKKNNANFAKADKNLSAVWNKLKKSMKKNEFQELLNNQRAWLNNVRDDVARNYINQGFSRVEAYTKATNDRAKDLPVIADKISKGINNAKEIKINKATEEKNINDDAIYTPSYEHEGEYILNKSGVKIILTVKIIDIDSMEAEIKFWSSGFEWSSKGWIDENEIETNDENFKNCGVTITFNGNNAEVVATSSEDWAQVIGTDNFLSGTYIRNL